MGHKTFQHSHSILLNWFLLLSVAFTILVACTDKKNPAKINQISEKEVREIYTFQDQRESDSLISYFKHPDARIRALAVQAYGSIQDSTKISSLFSMLLNDENVSVRRAAAFALGQSYDSTAANLLIQSLDQETSAFVRKEILEAIGKCIAQSDLSLYNVFEPENESDEEGLSWGLYRAGRRNVHDGVSVRRAVDLLQLDKSFETRLAAAHFLARTRDINIDSYLDSILSLVVAEKSAEIRMQLVSALAKSSDEKVVDYQLNLAEDPDPRVRVNALRSLGGVKGEEITSLFISKLADINTHVSVAASELLGNRIDPSNSSLLADINLSNMNWRVKVNILRILQNHGGDHLIPELKIEFEASDDPLEKAALLGLIGAEINEYEYVVTQTFGSEFIEVAAAGIRALSNLRREETFPATLKNEFTALFISAVRSDNVELMEVGASALVRMGEEIEQEQIVPLIKELKSRKSTLRLRRIIWMLEGHEESFNEDRPEKSINWNSVGNLRDEEEVVLITSKGDVRLVLHTLNAPGSVINFLELADSKYYEGVAFHRVVPNFVVQGGWNREDVDEPGYTIRSEFGMKRYETGTLGMASAGKDTEGTQFFITHSPTPHLDGNYTVFGSVTEGMDVVNELQVGDKIVEIQRIK